MLKKLLPKVKENLQKLPLLRKRQNKEETPEQNNLSPNLLSPLDTSNLIIKHSPAIIKTTNYVVIFISAVFLLLLFVNFLLDRQLANLAEQRDEILVQIEMNSGVERRVRDISKLIDIYRAKKNENKPISGDMQVIVAAINKHSRMQSMKFSRRNNTYAFSAEANSAREYAYLISDLLSTEQVESVIIDSVELMPSRRRYKASMQIVVR